MLWIAQLELSWDISVKLTDEVPCRHVDPVPFTLGAEILKNVAIGDQ